ncbi:Protein of unknown function (DUF1488) [Shewanella psychrophila]|uniref:Uncharacterized protein n=1 Tax=Shewanella psychrophila TaxID=225848 RepID=A0A1S6HIE7_9GAMM|nr:DUF1488 domain-containing protein [Shewanella psychrophila]AQS35303.1 Protein of unknown function (DUF1488) [Shewanella psychrophila]
MNQSVLFPDLQDWDDIRLLVIFPAQVQGANIQCRISLSRLAKLHGEELTGETQVLEAFERCRFDIEDYIEELIEQEKFDEDGGVSWC